MSSILDSILGSSGGASPSSSQGLPPDLAQAIGAGGSQGGDPGPQEQDEVQLLSNIIDDIHQFMKVAVDEDDKSVAATCLANFQKIRAKDQQETDGAMQGKTTPRMVRKAAAAQGGGPGGGY